MILPLTLAPLLLGSRQIPQLRSPQTRSPQIPTPPQAPRLVPLIAAPGTQGWVRAGIKPEDLVRRADARMAGLKNTIGEWVAIVNIPTGNGTAQGRNVLYAPGRYRIEVMRIDLHREEGVTKTIWTADAGRTRVLTDAGWQNKANYRTLITPLAPAFLTTFDDVLMRSTQGAKSATTLLASARKTGFTALVERRKVSKYSELRLLLTKGVTRYAIVWRENLLLPQRILVQSRDAKGRETRASWLAAWGTKHTPLTPADVKSFRPSQAKQ